MSTGKVLASTSTADSARSLARTSSTSSAARARRRPRTVGQVSGEENRPGGFFSVRHGFSFSLSASNSSPSSSSNGSTSRTSGKFILSARTSRSKGHGATSGASSVSTIGALARPKVGAGTVPVTPTFKIADRPLFARSPSRDSSENGLLTQNLPPLIRPRRAPHVDEMLTLSESGIEPRKGAAPSTSLDPGFKPVPGDALLVIDVQNDFIPGGALEVAGGHEVVPVCNALMDRFDVVVFSQDWHCPGHLSFASSHEGKSPYDSTQMPYGDQTLWPDHCIQGTSGSSFHADLSIPDRVRVVRKGFRKDIDSYSAFFENDQTTPTGLEGYLKDIGVRRVFVCGLASTFASGSPRWMPRSSAGSTRWWS